MGTGKWRNNDTLFEATPCKRMKRGSEWAFDRFCFAKKSASNSAFFARDGIGTPQACSLDLSVATVSLATPRLITQLLSLFHIRKEIEN